MPTNVQTALWQHVLDTADIYAKNAYLKNGLADKPGRIVVEVPEAPPAATVAPALVAPPVPPPASTAATSEGGLPKWMKTAATVGALALGGTGVGGAAVYGVVNGIRAWSGGSTGGGTTVVAPATPEQNGSLLQYLEDNGLHVPPEKRAKQ